MKPNKRLIRIGRIKKEKEKPRALPESKPKEVVINVCYGGFGLSHKATMEYYRRKGIKAYPFVEKRDEKGNFDWDHFIPFNGNEKAAFVIHYSSKPLNEDGSYDQTAYLDGGRGIPRDDPDLVDIVKTMGKKSWGKNGQLEIKEIPGDVEWTIEEYDGNEWVAEAHRTWR
jgi:hypothetical protein